MKNFKWLQNLTIAFVLVGIGASASPKSDKRATDITNNIVEQFDEYKRAEGWKENAKPFMPVLPRGYYIARVIDVIDGDNIAVLKDGKRENIRLYGIDAPELDQPYGEESKAFLHSRFFDKRVIVYELEMDRYNRPVALVIEVGMDTAYDAGMEQVSHGLAWAYRHYSDLYEQEDSAAQLQEIGLWRDKNPTPPWEHRKQKRQKANNTPK